MEEKSYKCGICLDKKEPMEWAEIGGIHIAEGNGDLCQYSCLGNSMDRGAWQAAVHGVAKSQT